MTTLSIKEVPEAWAQLLRERAARHHRSLQGELLAIIEQAVSQSEPAGNARPASTTLTGTAATRWPVTDGTSAIRRGTKTIEQIMAEQRLRHPQPLRIGPSSTELIREERDAR